MQFNEPNTLGCGPHGKCGTPCNLCKNLSCPQNPNRQNNGLGLININMRSSIIPIAFTALVAYIIWQRNK